MSDTQIKADSWRGHAIAQDDAGLWRYADSVLVSDDPLRACGHCGRKNTDEGHDGCLGTLPGIVSACCGHGEAGSAYAVRRSGLRLAGADAVAFFGELEKARMPS